MEIIANTAIRAEFLIFESYLYLCNLPSLTREIRLRLQFVLPLVILTIKIMEGVTREINESEADNKP